MPADLADKLTASLGAEPARVADYEAHRIACGVPQGGVDFAYGDAFPHETNMDRLHGVDFDKGCYIGQEVVSRMQHRGTARTRTVRLIVDGFRPDPGIDVIAGDQACRQDGFVGGRPRPRDAAHRQGRRSAEGRTSHCPQAVIR